jgi:hypothetical protein
MAENRQAEQQVPENRISGQTEAAQAHDSATAGAVSETWAEETIADLDDFIESQGIYIRQ